jgi:hypothetical protein
MLEKGLQRYCFILIKTIRTRINFTCCSNL